MRWLYRYLLMGELLAATCWLAVAWLHGWRFQWYTGLSAPAPHFAPREVAFWEQAVICFFVGFGIAALLVVPFRLLLGKREGAVP
jgi:hypothetical protein